MAHLADSILREEGSAVLRLKDEVVVAEGVVLEKAHGFWIGRFAGFCKSAVLTAGLETAAGLPRPLPCA
jgi:hypothetical protein